MVLAAGDDVGSAVGELEEDIDMSEGGSVPGPPAEAAQEEGASALNMAQVSAMLQK